MKWLIGSILLSLAAVFGTVWNVGRSPSSTPKLNSKVSEADTNVEFIASELDEFWDSFQSKMEELWMKGEKTATSLIANAGDAINAMDWLNSREQFVNTPGTMITAENLEITNPGEDCLPNQTLLYVNGYRFRLFGVTLSISSQRISLRFPGADKIDWKARKHELKILAHEKSGKVRWARVQHIGTSTPVTELPIAKGTDGVVIKLN
ncbi:hypothetical protein Ocin01_06035 [Orchesella cincta]|uniref:Uncharacterized protein n=1 Tax=Orchesella cincta TaxID=48709 RepID=A0A1D2N5V4_ORCCI|nr:hypothetical protein Ocin01_06035 [Orchesella cincta]